MKRSGRERPLHALPALAEPGAVTRDSLKRYFVRGEGTFHFPILRFRLFFRADATRLRRGYGVVEVEFRIASLLLE